MKEFVAASDDNKKVVFPRIEEEVEKLEGSTSRYFAGIDCLNVIISGFLQCDIPEKNLLLPYTDSYYLLDPG